MTSDKRIAANRRNALRSTGPRTQDGKARSRLNAVKHGLAASLPALVETQSSTRLARLLAPDAADEAATVAAARLAAAEAMIERCRHARADLAGGIIADETAGADEKATAIATAADRMAALQRYERRARRLADAARAELEALLRTT
jgi:hypothetical protein